MNSFESSPQLSELFTAVAKCQGEMKTAKRDSENPFFKSSYADLASCWETCREPLSKNGLGVIQIPFTKKSDDGRVISIIVKTILTHASGQWISGDIELFPVRTDPQGVGSAQTYARRYGLMAIVGIAADDDDGNMAVKSQPIAAKPLPKVETQDTKHVTETQLKQLYTMAHARGVSAENVKNLIQGRYNLNSSKEMTIQQYQVVMKLIKENSQPESKLKPARQIDKNVEQKQSQVGNGKDIAAPTKISNMMESQTDPYPDAF